MYGKSTIEDSRTPIKYKQSSNYVKEYSPL